MDSRTRTALGLGLAVLLLCASPASGYIISPWDGGRFYFDPQTSQGEVPFQWSYQLPSCDPGSESIQFTLEDGTILGGGRRSGGFVTTFFYPGRYTAASSYYCVSQGAVTPQRPLEEVTFTVGAGLKPPSRKFGTERCKKLGSAKVTAQGISCRRAREIAKALIRGKTPDGYTCKQPSNNFLVCGKGGTPGTETSMPRGKVADVITVLPGGVANCDHLIYSSRRYEVFAKRVTCQYARGNARRALQGERPVVLEFTQDGRTPLWKCKVFGAVAGICEKRTEDRVLAWQLKK